MMLISSMSAQTWLIYLGAIEFGHGRYAGATKHSKHAQHPPAFYGAGVLGFTSDWAIYCSVDYFDGCQRHRLARWANSKAL